MGKRGAEDLDLLRRQIEMEGLDGDSPVAVGLAGAIDRTENSGTNLMQDPVGPECTRYRKLPGILACQWSKSPGWFPDGTMGRDSRSMDGAQSGPGIRLDDRRLPWTGRFVRDYCHAFERLAPYFAGSPSHAASWTDALETRTRRRPDPAIADVVLQQLENREAPVAARTTAARLRAADTVAVVTGQQAGLFGGPLFTLHKAITTVRLARRLADEHGAAVVPVFWVDAEDHDLEEISGCHVLNGDLQRVPVSLSIDAPPGTSAAAVVLDDSIRVVLDGLRAALPPTEFTAEVLDALAASYAPGVRLVDAFARWLDRLLGHHGLVVFDASDPTAKPFVRSLFKREIRSPGRTAQLAADAGAELTALGYHAQASPPAGAVALFRLDGGRHAIRATDGTFASGGRTVAAQTLLEDIDSEPAWFSPNVLLRPVVQDTLLPTVAYVAGPNELAYLGQLRRVYAAFDVPMPIIYPRASATLVDAATVKFLSRYDVDFAQLQAQDDAAINRLLALQIPETIEQAIAAAEQSAAAHLDAIGSAVPTLDPTLAGAASSTAGRIARELGNLRGKVVSAAKRKDSTLRRQFQRARAQSFPGGAPQERSLAGIHFLNRYGFVLVDRLLGDLPLDPGHHWLLTV